MNSFYMMDDDKWAGEAQYVADWAAVEAQWPEYKTSFSLEDDNERDDFLAAWVEVDASDIADDEILRGNLLGDVKRGVIYDDAVRDLILQAAWEHDPEETEGALLPGAFERNIVRTETISLRFTVGELLVLDMKRGRQSRSDFIVELMKY